MSIFLEGWSGQNFLHNPLVHTSHPHQYDTHTGGSKVSNKLHVWHEGLEHGLIYWFKN